MYSLYYNRDRVRGVLYGTTTPRHSRRTRERHRKSVYSATRRGAAGATVVLQIYARPPSKRKRNPPFPPTLPPFLVRETSCLPRGRAVCILGVTSTVKFHLIMAARLSLSLSCFLCCPYYHLLGGLHGAKSRFRFITQVPS